MSKLSIYESGWLNLVFEGKNKQYGAYQLRQESPRTTLFAFILGLLCVSVFALVMLLVSSNNAAAMPANPDVLDRIIKIDNLRPSHPPAKLPSVPVKKTEPLKATDPKKPLANPVVVSQNPDDIETKKTPATTTETGTATGTTTPAATGGETGPATTTPIPTVPAPTPTGPETAVTVDVMPEFPGGIKKFLTYVGNNFEKPEIDETVTILMSFVIEKDGSMTDIKVLRNPGYGLDKEAIRVLKAQKTKWKPGIKNGQPVRVLYTLPIRVTRG